MRAAWQKARAHFSAAGHVPPESAAELEAMKGHTYYLFDPTHLEGAVRPGPTNEKGAVLLCGDSLGLAQPLTAEGILPAVLSGRLAAEAILAGAPESYPARLAAHPVIEDYRRVYRLREAAAALAGRSGDTRAKGNGNGNGNGNGKPGSRLAAPRRRQRVRLDVLRRAVPGAAPGRRGVGYCRALGQQSTRTIVLTP